MDKDNPPVLVSACLLGVACRYDGQSKVAPIGERNHLWPVCPEVMAGFGVPRPAIERSSDGGIKEVETGEDVRPALEQACLAITSKALELGVTHAVLKEGSPSCGSHRVWCDGKKVAGQGLLTEHLRQSGIVVTPES